jgi:hypothetical protein
LPTIVTSVLTVMVASSEAPVPVLIRTNSKAAPVGNAEAPPSAF